MTVWICRAWYSNDVSSNLVDAEEADNSHDDKETDDSQRCIERLHGCTRFRHLHGSERRGGVGEGVSLGRREGLLEYAILSKAAKGKDEERLTGSGGRTGLGTELGRE